MAAVNFDAVSDTYTWNFSTAKNLASKIYNKIAALFTLSDEVKNGWTVIGALCGTNWDNDFPMTNDGGIWKSDVLELKAGDELKVRQGLSWDNNFPAENLKVEADGNYVVSFDEAAGVVELVAQ